VSGKQKEKAKIFKLPPKVIKSKVTKQTKRPSDEC